MPDKQLQQQADTDFASCRTLFDSALKVIMYVNSSATSPEAVLAKHRLQLDEH